MSLFKEHWFLVHYNYYVSTLPCGILVNKTLVWIHSYVQRYTYENLNFTYSCGLANLTFSIIVDLVHDYLFTAVKSSGKKIYRSLLYLFVRGPDHYH